MPRKPGGQQQCSITTPEQDRAPSPIGTNSNGERMSVLVAAPVEQEAPFRTADPTRLKIWWALAMVVGAQMAIAAFMPVLPEEAYHWNFARHLDWGYYDHPPMIAWSIALGRLLLGDTPLGIRLIPLGFSLGTSWLLARLARCIYGGSAAVGSVRLYALMPAAFFIGGWGFPEAPVLFFWTLSLTC